MEKMNPFVSFMASSAGRVTRIAAGVALIAWGLLRVGGTTGIIVAAVGTVPLLAGLLDVCLLAPLFSCPLSGAKTRAGRG
jgi:hypothetical protein